MRCKCVMQSPCGNLMLIQQQGAIVEISFTEQPIRSPGTALLRCAVQQLREYFALKRTEFSFPIVMYGTEFQQSVWNELRKIPYGQTVTYQQIASRIGNERAVRAVGMANHNNPIAIVVPCHRVIGKNGSMVGYAAGVERKLQLLGLEQEGCAKTVYAPKQD